MTKRQQIVHTLSRHFTRGDIQGATDELLSLLDVVGQSEQFNCKVCGKPCEDYIDLHNHYDEEHNR